MQISSLHLTGQWDLEGYAPFHVVQEFGVQPGSSRRQFRMCSCCIRLWGSGIIFRGVCLFTVSLCTSLHFSQHRLPPLGQLPPACVVMVVMMMLMCRLERILTFERVLVLMFLSSHPHLEPEGGAPSLILQGLPASCTFCIGTGGRLLGT